MSTEDAWRALAEVNGWIRVADAKAAALLSLSGLLGGWIVSALPVERHPGLRTAILTAGLAMVFGTACMAIRALRPVVWKGPPHSGLHFVDISRLYASGAAFAAESAGLMADGDRLTRELCQQLWVNSTIATRKFQSVDRALMLLVPGLAATVAALLAEGW
ncbi:Pycsar system effector family protein [Spirillospora sp. NPDC046719]